MTQTRPAHIPGRWQRLTSVTMLFVLSPYCAEFLIGYQGGYVTDPLGLLVGLVFMAPLYGTIAIVIREIARLTGRGWPTILLLGTAFGVVQAGLIDQALFNHGWMQDTPYWEDLTTRVPGIDVDVNQFLVFVGGHTIWSFAVPIAVVEAAFPKAADRPWLGPIGLGAVALLYVSAARFYHDELVVTPGFQASGLQIGFAMLLTAVLITLAFIARGPAARPHQAPPRPQVIGVTLFVLLAVYFAALELTNTGIAPWPGVLLAATTLAVAAGLLWRWSSRIGWNRVHVLAAAAAPLLIYALLAFAVPPVGTTPEMKYLSNAIVVIVVVLLVAWSWQRSARWAAS